MLKTTIVPKNSNGMLATIEVNFFDSKALQLRKEVYTEFRITNTQKEEKRLLFLAEVTDAYKKMNPDAIGITVDVAFKFCRTDMTVVDIDVKSVEEWHDRKRKDSDVADVDDTDDVEEESEVNE